MKQTSQWHTITTSQKGEEVNKDELTQMEPKFVRQMLNGLDSLLKFQIEPDDDIQSESVLKNMEMQDEHFHKYMLVKYLQNRLEKVVQVDVERIVGGKMNNQQQHVLEDSIHEEKILDEIASQEKFMKLVSDLRKEMGMSVKRLMFSDFPLGDMPAPGSRSDGTPSNSSEYSWDNFVLQTNRMMTPTQRKRAAANLSTKNTVNVRMAAIEELDQMYPGDIVSNEHWDTVLKSLSLALADPVERISNKSLQLHLNFFKVAPPETTGEIYNSLVDHLIRLFGSHSETSFAIDASDSDKVFRSTIKKFRLLLQFQSEAPKHWIQFHDNLIEQFFKKTFQLLLINMPKSILFDNNPLSSPLVYMALVDKQCKWFQYWMKDSWARKYIADCLQVSKFVQRLVRLISTEMDVPGKEKDDINFARQFFTRITTKSRNEEYVHLNFEQKGTNSLNIRIRSYETEDLSYLVLQQAIAILGRLPLYTETSSKIEKQLLRDTIAQTSNHLGQIFFSDSVVNSTRYKRLIKSINYALVDNLQKHVNTKILTQILSPLRCLVLLATNGFKAPNDVSVGVHILEALSVVANLLFELFKDKSRTELIMSKPGSKSQKGKNDIANVLTSFFQFLFSDRPNCVNVVICGTARDRFELVFKNYVSNACWSDVKPFKSVAEFLSKSEDPNNMLLQFSNHVEGTELLRSVDAISICAIHLTRLCRSEEFHPQLIYIISQLSAYQEACMIFAKSGWLIDLLTDSFEQSLSNEWLPESEKTISKFNALYDGAELMYLLLASPCVIQPLIRHASEFFQMLFDHLKQRNSVTRSCLEIDVDDKYTLALTILHFLMFKLNDCIEMESKYGIISELQELNRHEIVDKIPLDESGSIRNKILHQVTFIGGADERNHKVLYDDYCHFNPSDFLLTNNEKPVLTAPVNQIRAFQMNLMDKVHKMKKNSNKIGLRMEELKFENLQVFEFDSKATSCGAKMIVTYGKTLGLLDKDLNELQQQLITVVHTCSSRYLKLVTRKSKNNTSRQPSAVCQMYQGYDWFVSAVYLAYEGDEQRVMDFLTKFYLVPESMYIWYKRGGTLFDSGHHVHPIFNLIRCVSYLLQTEFPHVLNSLQMRGLSLSVIVHRWMQQFFINYLNFIDIISVLSLILTFGIDYLVYFCVILLAFISRNHREDICNCEDYSKESWSYELNRPIENFKLNGSDDIYLSQMKSLEKKYRPKIMNMLQNISTTL